MQENNKEELDLFDHAPAGANDWQVVESSDAAVTVEPENEAPRPAVAPQIWDDIPREDPVANPKPVAEPVAEMEAEPFPEVIVEEIQPGIQQEVQPEIQAEIQPEVQPEIQSEVEAEPQDEIPVAAESRVSPVSATSENLSLLPTADESAQSTMVYRYVAPAEISTLADMGRYLAQMRKNANLSSDEVSASTKIRPDYLAAIEAGDASELPQAVYVLAYIRKLCELYSIDTSNIGDFFEDLRDGFSYELPEDINKSIVGHENDEEQQKKVRQLAIGLISAAAIVIIALVVGTVVLLVTLTKGTESKACTVSDRKIIEYQGKPTLYLQKLPSNR